MTLRVYDGRSFADPSKTIAAVRKKKGSGELSVRKSMQVGNLEDKIMDLYGIKVQIAGSDDSYLCDNSLTLAKAIEKDALKLAKKSKKNASDENPIGENTVNKWNVIESEVKSNKDSSADEQSMNIIEAVVCGKVYNVEMYKIDDEELYEMTDDDYDYDFDFDGFHDEAEGDEDKVFHGFECDVATCKLLIDNEEVDSFKVGDIDGESPRDNPWERGGALEEGHYVVFYSTGEGEAVYRGEFNIKPYNRDNLWVLGYTIDDETRLDATLLDSFSYDSDNGDWPEAKFVQEDVTYNSMHVGVVKYQNNYPAEIIREFEVIEK